MDIPQEDKVSCCIKVSESVLNRIQLLLSSNEKIFDRAFVHAIETSANPVSGLSGSGGDDKNNADEPIKMSGTSTLL